MTLPWNLLEWFVRRSQKQVVKQRAPKTQTKMLLDNNANRPTKKTQAHIYLKPTGNHDCISLKVEPMVIFRAAVCDNSDV